MGVPGLGEAVEQIMDQVGDSIRNAVARLAETLPTGHTPEAADWQALLSAGYTTDEQRAVASGHQPARTAQAATETTFF